MTALTLEANADMLSVVDTLKTAMENKHDALEAWFAGKRADATPPIYTSVDLRHSGFKLAPVDTNLFPAGFHNLSATARLRAALQFKEYIHAYFASVTRVLIVPENHTRNLAYLDNLHVLSTLLEQAGLTVKIGSLTAQDEAHVLTSFSGHPVRQEPLKRDGTTLQTVSGFVPELIISNNDFTSSVPQLLAHLAQPIIPSPTLGWHRRRKSAHFTAYNQLAREAASILGVDEWLISTYFHRCGVVNFRERTGVECVALGVEKVLHATRKKYAEHGIHEEPYVFIKADSGTYGMGIMTAYSGDELFTMNKKTRNKMDVIKEGSHNTEVIIQEGVPTIDIVENATAEPMIYLVDGVPVGGAYRLNKERDAKSNLNAQGMTFSGMCDEAEHDPARTKVTHCDFEVFGCIASIAALAAAREER